MIEISPHSTMPLSAYIDFLAEFEQHAIPALVYDRIVTMYRIDRKPLKDLFESLKTSKILRKSNPLPTRASTYILTPIGVAALSGARKAYDDGARL